METEIFVAWESLAVRAVLPKENSSWMGRFERKEIPGEEKYPVGKAGTEAESLLRGGLPAGVGAQTQAWRSHPDHRRPWNWIGKSLQAGENTTTAVFKED